MTGQGSKTKFETLPKIGRRRGSKMRELFEICLNIQFLNFFMLLRFDGGGGG